MAKSNMKSCKEIVLEQIKNREVAVIFNGSIEEYIDYLKDNIEDTEISMDEGCKDVIVLADMNGTKITLKGNNLCAGIKQAWNNVLNSKEVKNVC